MHNGNMQDRGIRLVTFITCLPLSILSFIYSGRLAEHADTLPAKALLTFRRLHAGFRAAVHSGVHVVPVPVLCYFHPSIRVLICIARCMCSSFKSTGEVFFIFMFIDLY